MGYILKSTSVICSCDGYTLTYTPQLSLNIMVFYDDVFRFLLKPQVFLGYITVFCCCFFFFGGGGNFFGVQSRFWGTTHVAGKSQSTPSPPPGGLDVPQKNNVYICMNKNNKAFLSFHSYIYIVDTSSDALPRTLPIYCKFSRSHVYRTRLM